MPISAPIAPSVRVQSLTRILGVRGDRLTLDTDEVRKCAGTVAATGTNADFIHSDDYTSVRANGQSFLLTTNQSMVIRALHEAHKRKTYWLTKDYLLETVLDTISNRLLDTFKSNKTAWDDLIVNDRRGRYRLNLPVT